VSEFESEPVPGLPERLPEGEALLWQGAPEAWAVARHVMHVYAVAGYFAVLIGWRMLTAWSDHQDVAVMFTSAVPLLLVAATAFGLIALVSWRTARTTVYSITSKRVVMRYGMALPVTVNVPYSVIRSADVRSYGDGTGEIALAVQGPNPLGYYHLWPHARAWYITKPQPAFRALENPDHVSGLLSKALHAAAGLAVPTAMTVKNRPVQTQPAAAQPAYGRSSAASAAA
jgi:hypothetical protein